MADPSMTRKSNGLDLTPETQAEIWQTAKYQSAFMQLVPEMKLPGNGARVPIITGDPEAAWVDEGAEKPKSGVGFGKKDMLPYTIAVIMPFSNQFKTSAPSTTKWSPRGRALSRAPSTRPSWDWLTLRARTSTH